jgi:hypothetical protein
VASLNGANAHELDRYSHILHTDCDCFITPAWNGFRSEGFVCGNGGYNNDAAVWDGIIAVTKELGLNHRGLRNTGSTCASGQVGKAARRP